MFALDLFNTDHERRIAEGAVDQLEQRRIDDLAMRMDDLVARAKTATTAEVKAALMKEFQKCKAERDSYYMVRNETMSEAGAEDYVGVYSPEAIALGKKFCEHYSITDDTDVQLAVEIIDSYLEEFKHTNTPIDLKKIKSGVANAFRQVYRGMGPSPSFRKKFQEGNTQIGDIISCPGDIRGEIIADEGDRWIVRDLDSEFDDDELEFRKSDCENYVDEAGIPGNVPVEKIPGKEDLLRGRGRSYYEADQKKNSDQFEGYQDFNKVEPYAVCLAGKPVKKFDYYEQARRFHNNWKQKLYREGNKAKADKITLMPLNLDETSSPAQQAAIAIAMKKSGDKPKQVEEGAMSNVHAAMADVYHRLAPKIERHRDSFLAGQLYDELENIAELHGIEPEFKRMMTGARNRAHMDYDTNPGGFQNWFWYLPFDQEELSEEQDTSGVERAILNRVMVAHTDLLMKFGPEKVMQAAEEVAYNVGDVDEIGTSDVSAYVNRVRQILGA